MTRLCDPPLEVGVGLTSEGAPGEISGALRGSLAPVARWMVELDWWRNPVAREYWKVVLQDRLLIEIFHDLDQDAWFLERIYD